LLYSEGKQAGVDMLWVNADLFQPASYFIWEEIQNWFNAKIKSIGVKKFVT